ncbi:MAG TPA: multicopper oxidase domain-containing protein [Xanthobacteraceae bacterium]|nr:multicopper oxidase domain-containing protein [Xanthobacteraceae bacterium]
MYYLSPKASRIRLREAQNARNNRAEIVKALSLGQITRRDLYKWGLLTTTGVIALKNGLSPLAPSAFADGGVPTGTPPSPLFGAQKFTQRLNRLAVQAPQPLTRIQHDGNPNNDTARWPAAAGEVLPVSGAPKDAKRLSYHDDFSNNPGNPAFINPVTHVGPIEGRAPTDPKTGLAFFAHQRWAEFFPTVGRVMSLTQAAPNTKFHPNFPAQDVNSVWTYGTGNTGQGTLPPFLCQVRYGEPTITRIYNNTPVNRANNNGFGRNESQLHYHNAHNGAESDGASNSHHFPGTFYDYRWSGTLARRDKINTQATDPRASAPTDTGGLVNVPGDWREIQGTMWAHDHRFFFTAENVYKGNLGMVTMYSGRDRGNEVLNDGINLRLPSGSHRANTWGNLDFDVNLIISDAATDPTGQLFFDIFTTDGFLGDLLLVNFQYAPFMEVLPRKYRFRTLSAGMSRFIQLQIADAAGNAVPFLQIANDGNFFVSPISLTSLDEQGTAERYDIIVDFSRFRVGDVAFLVNTLQQTDGRKPDGQVPLAQALAGVQADPAVGAIVQFRIVSQIQSVDDPTVTLRATDPDPSQVPAVLTEQIPIVTPVRTRVVQWGRSGNGDSVQPNGTCIPDCATENGFPWTVIVDNGQPHSMNANRVQLEYQHPGTIEHWTYVNGGGGWDHPIHLHFEEGITLNRGGDNIPATELNVRKDVWRLRPSGQVTFQIQFGEYGGSYVNHCHNTVHEDFALLMRIQLLNGFAGTPQAIVTRTPNPSPSGVTYTDPIILPEAL